MTKYNTNLASEFYVLSMLHRLGANEALTLGNKKAIDIFIFNSDGSSFSVDVKGVEKKYDWPADNIDINGKVGHFLVLVCFENKIEDPLSPPISWIIPSKSIKKFIRKYKKRAVVSRSEINTNGDDYKNAWHQLIA